MVDFQDGLGCLSVLSDAESRSISVENPNGERGGAKAPTPDAPHSSHPLGESWKVRSAINLASSETVALADIEGPAVINLIWSTLREIDLRYCVIHSYRDDREAPSVESSNVDFFANAHGLRYNANSTPLNVNSSGVFNSYWQMAFRKRTRIVVENQRWNEIRGFPYQFYYSLIEVPKHSLDQWHVLHPSRFKEDLYE